MMRVTQRVLISESKIIPQYGWIFLILEFVVCAQRRVCMPDRFADEVAYVILVSTCRVGVPAFVSF